MSTQTKATLFTVEVGGETYKDQDENDVNWRINNVRADNVVKVTPQLALQEFLVFYGGDDRRYHFWQGWNQVTKVQAPSHREAVVRYLYCNHSAGTRFGVVGTEIGHPNYGTEVLRHFKLEECWEADSDYYYRRGKAGLGEKPLKVVEINL